MAQQGHAAAAKSPVSKRKHLLHSREEKMRVVFDLYGCEEMERECLLLPKLDRLDHSLQRSLHSATTEKGLARWRTEGTQTRVKGGSGSLISLK